MNPHADFETTPRRDLSIPMGRAQGYGLALMLPTGLLLVLPYLALWGGQGLVAAWGAVVDHLLLTAGAVVGGIVVHELLHGLTWQLAGKPPAGAVTYGFHLKTLTPYAHCKTPMDVQAYRLGAAMPGLVLGLAPWLAALVSGNGLLLLFGLLFTIAALGDAMILWLLRGVPPGRRVIDHPHQAGCYVLESEGRGKG